MKHIIKKIITMMLAIVVAMGIMTFERKTVDAARTTVSWNRTTWDPNIYILGSGSYTLNGVTVTCQGSVDFHTSSSTGGIAISKSAGNSVSFTTESGVFTKITMQCPESNSLFPEDWKKTDAEQDGDVIVTWTGNSDTVTVSGGDTDYLLSFWGIDFVIEEPDLVLNVTPPKCGTIVVPMNSATSPSPEVEITGNCLVLEYWYRGETGYYNGEYNAGDEFKIEFRIVLFGKAYTNENDIVISVNENLEVVDLEIINQKDDETLITFCVKGTVGSDCEVEPDDEIITEVKVNVTPPKEGAAINKPKVKLPKGVHYHLKREPDGWYDATYVNFDHDVFQASDVGESAMLILNLVPDEGYRFADEDSLSVEIKDAGIIDINVDSDGVLVLNPEFKIQAKDPKPSPVPIPKTGVDAADPYVLFRNIGLLGVCLIGSVLFITKKK